ncbi:hypothetical protein NLI96_g156 [Meripilus lineatus]|uniref:F-box domain-containing protein n=1 Tax=Meripilus lineatus TaxID=2056292 RepID=A0AAD5VF09_9APHY|nr:hypothetical protein NLI96_g156 [Physisporinus lineatus]
MARKFNPFSFKYIRQRLRKSLLLFQSQPIASQPGGDSPAQRLPPEILIIILSPLAEPIFVSALSYSGLLFPTFTEEQVNVPKPDKALKDLLNALRVCRAWNLAGTRLLYSSPYLTSQKRVRLFNRSLQSNPSLGNLVDQVFILQRLFGDKPWFPTTRDPRKDSERKDMMASLRRCPGVKKMTITAFHNQQNPIFWPWDDSFLEETTLGSHLQELAVYGDALPTPKSTPLDPMGRLSLPCLEILSLSQLSLESNHEFPKLPKLHTLRISYPHKCGPPEKWQLRIDASRFPSLQKLTLNEINAPIIIDEEILPQLNQLLLFGKEENDIFKKWGHTASLEGVRDLTMDLSRYLPGQFKPTKFPKQMESLTLFFSYKSDRASNAYLVKAYALDDLNEVFAAATKDCAKLKDVSIMCRGFDDLDAKEFDELVVKLRTICEMKEISLKANYYGLDDYLDFWFRY